MKKKYFICTSLVILSITILMITGCAHNPTTAGTVDRVYGFWWGLWNGFTLLWSFFGRMFSDTIVMYATDNVGRLYDLGFWIGAGGLGFTINIARK